MAMRGLFITFEGTEGSGKTTQAELLGEWLSSRDPVAVREPGGTELGEQIRDVLLYKGLEIDPEAEMYLFMASRRQLIAEAIAPALAAAEPNRFVRLDATGSRDKIHLEVRDHLKPILEKVK